MLPDLRVVVIAVISTFLLTVSVAFYTSARLGHEPRKSRPESLAAFDDSPVNRIALNWPEPVQPAAPPLDLDFAVSAKSLRNPVREVANDTGATLMQPPAAASNESAPAAPQKEEKEEQPAKLEIQAAAPAAPPDSAPDPVVTATIPTPSAKEEPAPSAQPEPAERIASHTADPVDAAAALESEAKKEQPVKKRAAKKTKPAKAAKPEPAKTTTPRRARSRAATAAGNNRSGFPFNILGTSFPN